MRASQELRAEWNKYLHFMHVAFVVQDSLYSLSPTMLLFFFFFPCVWNGASLIGQLVKNLPAMQETQGSDLILGSGRSPGEGNGNPLLYSCLENPMDRGAWQATVHGVARARQDLATKPPYLKWIIPVLHLTTVFQHLLYLLLENFHNFCQSLWTVHFPMECHA